MKDEGLTGNFEINCYANEDLSDEGCMVWSTKTEGKGQYPTSSDDNLDKLTSELKKYIKNCTKPQTRFDEILGNTVNPKLFMHMTYEGQWNYKPLVTKIEEELNKDDKLGPLIQYQLSRA